MNAIILLDGGMGQELVARSQRPAGPLWSAEVMMHEPEIVAAAQRDFLAAGATVITLNAYSATPERLARVLGPEEAEARFETLQRRAIEIARAAVHETPHRAAVAGCLPPLVASYHAEVTPSFEACLATYERIAAIQGPHCDLLLAETMSSVREARAAVRAMREAGRPAWVALSVDDADGTRLRSGEALGDALAAVLGEGPDAVLLNCSRPEAITQGLGLLAGAGVPFGAYANGFTDAAELEVGSTVDGMGVRDDLGPDAYAEHAMGWVQRGATIVGGCCEVGPAHIAALHARLRAAGHDVVAPRFGDGPPP
jgi:S-methylmethionine-dependent homocysteine/selenocysteine methylase